MKFQRGQDPKKAMDIGLAKDAIEICGVAEFIMQPNGKEYVKIEDEERVIVILRQLQANKYGSDPNDIKFLRDSWATNMWGSRKKAVRNMSINKDYKTPAIIDYKGKLYIIPPFPTLWAQWQDVQYSRHLYKNGGYELA